ncbi:hypothetical protein D9611_007383 [Ephemerocybe angulata]|uniref:Uncharacterized protein n=1 Tax=Ephemerocybe angulata TaxID=980116 RepID=A0A8H5FL51_9AGAR|nr:hypothetical protein D9611_007383 [Tulosesus angulatus]
MSTPRKTHGSAQPLSSSAVQHDLPLRRSSKGRTVNNLDPGCLDILDIVDLCGPVQPTVNFGGAPGRLPYHDWTTAFPPGSRGFLYYHSSPGQSTLAGEIRVRVLDAGLASDSAADLFASGRDLPDYTGYKPWRIHLLQLYASQRYDSICRLLQSQGLIDAARVREAKKQVSVAGLAKGGRRSSILNTISGTFVVRLPIQTFRLAFVHNEGYVPAIPMAYRLLWGQTLEPDTVASWRVYKGAVYDASPCCQQAPDLFLILVFSGYAVLRFELKKVLRNENRRGVREGEIVLVIRILELLDPVGSDGVPFRLPEGGDLVQTQMPEKGDTVRTPARRFWYMTLGHARKLGIITPSSLEILEDRYHRESAPIEARPPPHT